MSEYAFLGAGEFEDWHTDVDRSLLEGRSGPVLVFATASAPEGDEVYQSWVDKGLAHYAAAGIDAVAPWLRTREDAHDPAIVAQVDEAAMVFFSGGNPAYLAKVLLGSPVWDRIRERVAPSVLEAVEEMSVVAETPADELPPQAIARIGLRRGQKNVLVRLVLRHPTCTLTAEEANRTRDDVYAAIHEGSVYEWADRKAAP